MRRVNEIIINNHVFFCFGIRKVDFSTLIAGDLEMELDQETTAFFS